ncbi:MAG: agmatinase [Candidatus Omnitrophota bacterium]|jgi:agmatinase
MLKKKNRPDLRFCGLEEKFSSWENSGIVVLPVAYDLTTSYGHGAIDGPRAIIDASRYLETYDEETGKEVFLSGIHTAEEIRSSKLPPEAIIEKVEEKTTSILEAGKFPVIIGGEHSITLGAVNACKKKTGDFSVLQLDAHSDMKDVFQGWKYSHGCVARRIAEVTDIVQAGIRSLSKEESGLRLENVTTFLMKDMVRDQGWLDSVIGAIKKEKVYVTIDMDALDPSIMPSVGTPEPGGLGWYETLALLKRLSEKKKIIGFDAVELAPVAGNAAPDFLTAKLIYKFLTYIF